MKLFISIARVCLFLTIMLIVAVWPDFSHPVIAQAPTPFLAAPYYGTWGVSRRWIPNLHYGIDFTLNYGAVLAAAAGTIDRSRWDDPFCHDDQWHGPTCSNGTRGYLGLYVRIYHGPTDHPYYTFYGHLSVARFPGTVRQGERIGLSGDTGDSTGPHLHFEVRHDGEAPGFAVNPDSENGISLWTVGEWAGPYPAQSVPSWRFSGPLQYSAMVTVDDTPDNTGGFTKGSDYDTSVVSCPPNSCPYWTTTTGYDGDAYFTYVWTSQKDYWAKWQPTIAQAGLYGVRVYFPCAAVSRNERSWFVHYRVHAQSGDLDFHVDQVDRCDQWVNLAQFYFAVGNGGYVYLFDDTNERQYDPNRKILVDAVSFHPVVIKAFETESYDQGPGLWQRTPRSSHDWTQSTALGGYIGNGYMEATPNTGLQINTGYTTSSPEMQYQIPFPAAGTYHVWLRGYGGNGADDSIHAGLDGQAVASADRICGCGWINPGWQWGKGTLDGTPATIYVNTPGLHIINLWMREDGFRVDQVLLTQDANYAP